MLFCLVTNNRDYSFAIVCPFLALLMSCVVCTVNRCRMVWMRWVCCAYIVQNLLAATCTASVKALIGPAACYAGVCTLAESVHQNCVLGRCTNLCSIIVLHTPPMPCPRHLKTCPILLPRPPKVINNNNNSLEPAAGNCQTSIQRKVLPCRCQQPTQRTLILPAPPTPVGQQIRKMFIAVQPPCSNSQYHNKQHISGPCSARNNKHCPPLLPSPSHLHTIRGRQGPVITGPHPHTWKQLSPQVSIYLPVIVLTLTDQFINLLASKAQFTSPIPYTWNIHTV